MDAFYPPPLSLGHDGPGWDGGQQQHQGTQETQQQQQGQGCHSPLPGGRGAELAGRSYPHNRREEVG